MANSEEQVSKFMQAITAYAEEQSRQIHKEVEDFRKERLHAAEKEVLRDSYLLIQQEQADMRRELSREMSLREMQARQALLSRRRDMMAAIFERAQQKLVDYAGTAAYRGWMTDALQKMAAQLPAEGTVYAVSPRDEALVADLAAACPVGSAVETADDIQLGGIRGVNTAAGVMIDNTFDERLADQQEWFTEHSGLVVEE